MMSYLSSLAIPFSILIIVTYGLIEKNKVFDTFLDGAKEGIAIVAKIFPSLLGLFVVVGALKASGILEQITILASTLFSFIKFPAEIVPLVILRPISGSASIATAVETLKTYGIDSFLGNITSTIMGSTETTLYTIAIYTGAVKIKKTRGIIIAGLIGDAVRNCNICRYLALFVVKFLLTFLGNYCRIRISNF